MSQKGKDSRPRLTLERVNDVEKNLAPELQHRLACRDRRGRGIEPGLAAATGRGRRVEVIARLERNDLELPSFKKTGSVPDRDSGFIVTGWVDEDRIEEVRRWKGVLSLKGSRPVRPQLRFSVPKVRADRAALGRVIGDIEALRGGTLDGSGVVIGVVDFGCDVRHHRFQSDGRTRVRSLWDQRRDRNDRGGRFVAPRPFGYGRELTEDDINRALASRDPYGDLDYEPEEGAHGTHVLDIAAGRGNGIAAGVAPGAEIVFVHLAVDDVDGEQSLGSSARLIDAVTYVFDKADKLGLPAVVNLSVGMYGGPHDGSSLVERALDGLVRAKRGRQIVIAAGNANQENIHASGHVANGALELLAWDLNPNPGRPDELEIWYSGSQALGITLISPNGARFGPIWPGETHRLVQDGKVVGSIVHRAHDPNNGDNQIDILLSCALSRDTWRLELRTASTQPVSFHAWIERDDLGQSSFVDDHAEPASTLNSIACGESTIVVGAFDGLSGDMHAPFSSQGPTRTKREKPDVCAPGVSIRAARALGGAVSDKGTSMAAPHVTGLVALLFQAAMKAGRELPTADEVLAAIRASANRVRLPSGTWDQRHGYGRADAARAIERLLGMPVNETRTHQRTAALIAASVSEAPPANGTAPLELVFQKIVDSAGSARIEALLLRIEPSPS